MMIRMYEEFNECSIWEADLLSFSRINKENERRKRGLDDDRFGPQMTSELYKSNKICQFSWPASWYKRRAATRN